MKTAIITDSTAYLPEELKNDPQLSIVPIPIILDGKVLNEGQDVFAKEYYDLLKNSLDFPKTSQPVIGEVLKLIQHLQTQGYEDAILITLSSGISGYFSTVNALKDEVPGIKVWPFDSLITSVPMGAMVKKALEMAREKIPPAKIIDKLADIRENMTAYMIVDDLNHLVRGGRLTNGAALIGGLLKIKPVLTFDEGKIVVSEKIRTSRKAFNRVEDLLLNKAEENHQDYQFFIIHANYLEAAEEEKARLLAKNPQMEIEIAYFGPVIGTHLGEKALGFGWVKK